MSAVRTLPVPVANRSLCRWYFLPLQARMAAAQRRGGAGKRGASGATGGRSKRAKVGAESPFSLSA